MNLDEDRDEAVSKHIHEKCISKIVIYSLLLAYCKKATQIAFTPPDVHSR